MNKAPDDLLPHYWVFQFNPHIYDWFGWIGENKSREQWLASRYSDQIGIGDKVVIWASGEKSGIYGLGKVVTYPLKKPLNPEQAKYYKSSDDLSKFERKKSVWIEYLSICKDWPLLKSTCKEDAILSSMEVLNDFYNATNFQLKEEQWERILSMIQ